MLLTEGIYIIGNVKATIYKIGNVKATIYLYNWKCWSNYLYNWKIMCVCIYIYTCIHVYIYIYINIWIYTLLLIDPMLQTGHQLLCFPPGSISTSTANGSEGLVRTGLLLLGLRPLEIPSRTKPKSEKCRWMDNVDLANQVTEEPQLFNYESSWAYGWV